MERDVSNYKTLLWYIFIHTDKHVVKLLVYHTYVCVGVIGTLLGMLSEISVGRYCYFILYYWPYFYIIHEVVILNPILNHILFYSYEGV